MARYTAGRQPLASASEFAAAAIRSQAAAPAPAEQETSIPDTISAASA